MKKKKQNLIFRQEIDSICKIYKSLVTSSANTISKSSGATIGTTPGVSPAVNKVEVIFAITLSVLLT